MAIRLIGARFYQKLASEAARATIARMGAIWTVLVAAAAVAAAWNGRMAEVTAGLLVDAAGFAAAVAVVRLVFGS
jgi:hypothetical protein